MMDNWPKYIVDAKIKIKAYIVVFDCLFSFNLHYDCTYQGNPLSSGCHMLTGRKENLSGHKIKDCR